MPFPKVYEILPEYGSSHKGIGIKMRHWRHTLSENESICSVVSILARQPLSPAVAAVARFSLFIHDVLAVLDGKSWIHNRT
jgi:hypothetical protein